MATLTETTANNTVHNDGQVSQRAATRQAIGFLERVLKPLITAQIVLKRGRPGRPSNAEKGLKAAQRAAAPEVSQQTILQETSENIAAAALQKLGTPSGQAEQNIIPYETDGELLKECLPLLAIENETSENAFDEQKTKEVFMLAKKGSQSAGIRKQSLKMEEEQDQKEQERLQKKSEELDLKYQKQKAELDKILKEKDELKKEFKLVDARASKRKALDKQLDTQVVKIRAIASTAGEILKDLRRHLQIISASD